MVLTQSIILKAASVPEGADALFFKETNNYSTWFNLLNLEKIKYYTSINSIAIEINYTGSGQIEIDGNLYNLPEDQKKQTITLNYNTNSRFLGLNIKNSNNLELKDAKWLLTTQTTNNINPAIIICTYNRHDYIYKTIKTISNNLPHNWKVYVIDNSSDPAIEYEHNNVTVIKNPNTGGSGGFTRGIMEAIQNSHSHALLMDDDIVIEPSCLEKTHNLLMSLKPEFKEHFIAGGMLDLHRPTIQHESTAWWDGLRVRHLNHNLDLSEENDIKKSEKIRNNIKNQYAAWWYCCIPLSKEMINDLPFPFFVNGDDIEYSLRRAKGFITMNGISVWHEPFHLKYNIIKQHYLTVRNGLFINTKHNYNRMHIIFKIIVRYMLQIIKGQKTEAKWIIKGVDDYLKGPEVLNTTTIPFTLKLEDRYKFKLLIKQLLQILFNFRKLKKKTLNFSLNDKLWHDINSIC